ncbi:hypothetical protein LTR28_008235 [Elasticomyces elasticus]|nr:hypothetical protein LTR28_008235 [Elasticomyces elasticus]
MHITGGQPARAPEILSVRYSNTVRGGHRNVFIEDGVVVFVTRYYKGSDSVEEGRCFGAHVAGRPGREEVDVGAGAEGVEAREQGRSYRDIAIGISRKFMRRPTAFHTDEDDDRGKERDKDDVAAAIADEQAGHTSHIAGMIYARGRLWSRRAR